MLSSRAKLAIVPTRMSALNPDFPCKGPPGVPHKGASRGNSMNSTTMMGAPNSAIFPAIFAAAISGGLPTGMCALTKAVNKPISATSMAKAVSSDCENKKLLSMQKKPRKNTTNASRCARSSNVLSASNITSKVTPASRPKIVLCVANVAATATTSKVTNHQRFGKG